MRSLNVIAAEILATGEEIRTGALIDSNSAYIAQKLEETGVTVSRHTCVGDDIGQLIAAFKEVGIRADIAVVTGGLGPTSDDLTAAAAAEAAAVKLAENQTALESVEKFFKSRRRAMNFASRKQAMLPEGATCLPNAIGTAPGFRLAIGKCQFFFLPGVPDEMRRMLSDTVLPQLQPLLGDARIFNRLRTLSIFGLTESQTNERLSGLAQVFPQISLGMRIRFPEILVNLYAKGLNERHLKEDLESTAQWVVDQLGDKVISLQGEPMAEVVGKLLREKQATLALAESCTGGLIADILTNVSGSSDYFVFSGITYSNQAKIDILHVSQETIARHGAVHEETVKEMALGARSISGANYGLATSGIAGPAGGTQAKPVGTVCIAMATPHDCMAYRFYFWFGSRKMHKQMFAAAALDVLRRELLGLDPPRF
jgi:competence/damage-inducible protein CinA-like protein